VDILLATDACLGATKLKSAAIDYIITRAKTGELSITHKRFQRLPKILFAQITDAVMKKHWATETKESPKEEIID